jgi:ABC-2 type transport system permease protein
MAANVRLYPVKARGWTAGLVNLMKRELADWWKTRRWLKTTLLWLVIINGLLLLVLNQSGKSSEIGGPSPAEQAVQIFCIFSGFACPIAVMVATQGSIVGEKQNGTAAWILSKPVSRIAFILSKLLADTLGFLVTMVLIQGLVGYILMSVFGIPVTPWTFLMGLGLLYLNLLFFQSFSMMMGTMVNNRGTVIGVSLLLIFALNQLSQMSFGMYLPGHLPYDAAVVMGNQPLPNLYSLLATTGLSIVFIGLAFWRFNREEF